MISADSAQSVSGDQGHVELERHSGCPVDPLDETYRDASDPTHGSAALPTGAELYRSTLDTMLEGVVIVGFDGACLYVNDSAAHQGRRLKEELIGRRLTDIYHDFEKTPLFPALRECLDSRTPSHLEDLFTHSDGSQCWLELSIQPVPEGASILSIDRTCRQKAVAEIREREERYRGLVDNINLGITLIAPDFRVVTTNAAHTRISDRPIQELVGHHCFHVFRRRDSVCPDCPGRRAMDSGRPADDEHCGVRRDGSSLMARVQAFPLFQPDGSSAGFIEVVEDITEQRKMQQHLQQSQKMEAIGQLAGGIAHDFRNQLTVIRGYGQMLRDSIADDKGREMLDEILQAADRSVEITGQLLAFSRRDTLHPQTHDLNGLVADLTKALQRIIGEDIVLTTAADPAPCPATVDATQFQHALMNLATNARDAMPTGGGLTIRTRRARTNGDFAEQHPEVTPGHFVVVEVTDTGSGMDSATKARIFEPFFTTKQVGQGTGLGLAMVYGFVRQSGGTIEVDSEPAAGTTMRLFFPVATAEQAEPAVPRPAMEEQPRGHETILVVEDESAVRKLLLISLRQAGYRVIESANGADALRLADRHAGPIDLLITDVIMPGADGVELSCQLRQRRPGIGVLYVSGYAGRNLAQRGVNGESNLLGKPFTRDELLAAVRQVLRPSENRCGAMGLSMVL